MKKHMFICGLTAALLSGCYADKGNYSYSDPQTITVSGMDESGYVRKLYDRLTIEPTVEPAGGDYEYTWVAYIDGQYTELRDTLSTSREMDIMLDMLSGQYKLTLIVRDARSGVFGSASTTLSLEGAYERGWYILKENNGTTDIDFVSAGQQVDNLLYTQNAGYTMPGKPLQLLYVQQYYDERDPVTNHYIRTNRIFAMSDEQLVTINLSDGNITREFDDMFFAPPAVRKPEDLFFGQSAIHLRNDGQIYSIITNIPNTGRFVVPFSKQGDISTKRISSDGRGPVLWNANTRSFTSLFLEGEDFVTFPDQTIAGLTYKNNSLDSDLLAMGVYCHKYSPLELVGWAILKNRTDGKAFCKLFDGRPQVATGTTIEGFTTNEIDVPAEVVAADVTRWAGLQKGYYLYYLKGRTIFLYSINYGTSTQVATLPDSGDVTFMHHLYSSDTTSPVDCLAVATYSGGNYKVYLYNIGAGYSLEPDPEIIAGSGRVARMMHIVPQQEKCTTLHYNFD